MHRPEFIGDFTFIEAAEQHAADELFLQTVARALMQHAENAINIELEQGMHLRVLSLYPGEESPPDTIKELKISYSYITGLGERSFVQLTIPKKNDRFEMIEYSSVGAGVMRYDIADVGEYEQPFQDARRRGEAGKFHGQAYVSRQLERELGINNCPVGMKEITALGEFIATLEVRGPGPI